MMEHILMHDWYENRVDELYFVEEDDLDHCATEKILRNQFFDPLVSSDSEDEVTPNIINWDEIFKKTNKPLKDKLFVPCLRQPPPYPKVSEINPELHYKILKILSAEYPNVLKDLPLQKPKKQDFKAYEDAKETYLKEQKEFKEWAKSLWVTDHCIRALRPKPAVERVYEAEFQMKAQRMQALPKHYNVAAQITLEDPMNKCDAGFKQELIRVNLAEMPTVQIPDNINKPLSIIRPCTVPEPCQKHPYQIVLPNEDALSMLPITEIHRELATFALANNTQFIASENALKCLTQWNRHWLLPLSVCDIVGPDGNIMNVMVLDSEFSVHKEAAPMRTYKAYRHLLENALIPSSEKHRIWEIRASRAKKKEKNISAHTTPNLNENANQDADISSGDEDNHLYIDTGEGVDVAQPKLTDSSSSKAEIDSSNASCLSPKAGITSQNGGYLLRNASCLSPKAGFASPNASITSPKAGFASPNKGISLSNSGYALRNASCLSPKAGFASPNSIITSPKAGFASPNGGITSSISGYALRNASCLSPKAGFASPNSIITSPKAGFASPNGVITSSNSGYALRNASCLSPKAGFASPNANITSPKAGFALSNGGITSSNSGYALRNASCLSPKAGFASPNASITSPKAGFASLSGPSSNSGYALRNATCLSPKAGFSPSKATITSPRAGFSPPKTSITSPKPEFTPPNAGFISPSASFGSPKELSFGPPPAKQMRGKTDENPRRSARLCRQDSVSCLPVPSSSKVSEESPVVPDIGVYSCTCKDTVYEKPPRRSFRKWQFRKESTNEKLDIIIHSPHKARDKTGELLIEPLPEYQIDLGASEQTPDAVRSAALSLALRENASLLNVRIDGPTGEIVTFEKVTSEAFAKRHPDVMKQVISTVYTALSQLQELRPGHYVLQHDPSHYSNAMLMCPHSPRHKSSLSLNFDAAQLIEVDEAQMSRIPPTITTALLPFHKHRRTLPCAFTPYENMVAKETKKPPPKKKVPPQAIKFPKKKRKKNNRR